MSTEGTGKSFIQISVDQSIKSRNKTSITFGVTTGSKLTFSELKTVQCVLSVEK